MSAEQTNEVVDMREIYGDAEAINVGEDANLATSAHGSIRNQKGRFIIKTAFLHHHPGLVTKIMAHMVIWRAEYIGMESVVQYDAKSALFDEVKAGDAIPNYIIRIVNDQVLATKVD